MLLQALVCIETQNMIYVQYVTPKPFRHKTKASLSIGRRGGEYLEYLCLTNHDIGIDGALSH